MFVCNCNGLRRRDVDLAVASGATRPAQIFASHNCSPQCAKCVCDMVVIIRDGMAQVSRKSG
jgi:bacterioferritin-associated ferredoxin